ncbi:carboxypeptidase regulatory-like domain-containing protein [Natronorubrum sp. DTA7]|uniref:carboxypeptidase regulatory-like domain-containing protein n=1 Tax=Natronorubrum sp. DTA7 TaxID=3447016 RepID=UPI003F8254D2
MRGLWLAAILVVAAMGVFMGMAAADGTSDGTQMSAIEVTDHGAVATYSMDGVQHRTIDGVIEDTTFETGVAGVEVTVENGEGVFTVVTDGNGFYSVDVPETSEAYTVSADPEGWDGNSTTATVDGGDATGIDLELTGDSEVRVTLTDRVTGAPLEGGTMIADHETFGVSKAASADESGFAEISVPGGFDYEFTYANDGYEDYVEVRSLDPGERINPNYVLSGTAEITGEVRDEVTGEGIDEATVTAQNGAGAYTAETNEAGAFTIEYVPGGHDYDLTFEADGYNENTNAELTVGDGATAEVDETLLAEPFFAVEITETNTPVTVGETLSVTATVTNLGEGSTQTVTLIDTGFDNEQRVDRELTLVPGESETVTLEWDTVEGDDGEGTVSVATTHESVDASVTIEPLYAGGNGMANTPYEIETWYHLDNVRENLDSDFVLNNGLNESTEGYDEVASRSAHGGDGFEPIARDTDSVEPGYQGTPFTGTFDGGGHTISDLSVNRGSTDYVGLFGYTETGSSVVDVGLINVTVTADGSSGTLVGRNYGTVARSFATGDLDASGSGIGGLVAINNGDILDSYASVNVTSTGSDVGGLVGDQQDGTIAGSYATGSIEGDKRVGGLMGYHFTGPVTDSYWDTESTGRDDATGGGVFNGDATGLSTSQMTDTNATAFMPGFEFPAEGTEGTWHATGAYPALAWQDTEPFYEVNVTDTNAPIDEGDTLEVTANVTNWAADGVQTVELRDFDGNEQDTEAVTLESGGSEEYTLQWDTVVSDAGMGSVTVTSGDDSDCEEVTIETIPQHIDANVTSDGAVADGDDEVEFIVTIEDSNGNPFEGTTVTVEDAATVDDLDGIGHGDEADTDAAGEATFNATSTDASAFTLEFSEPDAGTDTATATFGPGDVTKVELDPAAKQTIDAGETIDFEATAFDEFENVVEDDGSAFNWTNAQNGTFNETAAGEYDVTAELDKIESDATTVAVEPAAINTVEIEPDSNQTLVAGETINFEAIAFDEFDNPVEHEDTAFNWTNANNGTFEETTADEYEVTAELNGVESAPTTVTVEAAPSSGDRTSNRTSVESDQTTSVRTVGNDLRADITPTVSHGISESYLEFSNTRTIELRFSTNDTADEDRPVATTETLAIEFTESIDTALTIREASEPTSEDARDLDHGLEAVGYLQIATDFEPDQLDSATIEFSVPTEALDSVDGDTDAVSLYHFDPETDEWRPLETTVVDVTEDELRFSAGVDSFSQFAVGVGPPDVDDEDSSADEMDDDDAPAVDDDSNADEANDDDPSGVNDDSSAHETDSDSSTEDVDDGTPGFGIGVTLLAIVVFLVAGRQFRNGNKHS